MLFWPEISALGVFFNTESVCMYVYMKVGICLETLILVHTTCMHTYVPFYQNDICVTHSIINVCTFQCQYVMIYKCINGPLHVYRSHKFNP